MQKEREGEKDIHIHAINPIKQSIRYDNANAGNIATFKSHNLISVENNCKNT